MNEQGCIITVERKFSFQTTFLDLVLRSEGTIQPSETRMDAILRVNKELEETAARLRKEAGVSANPIQPLVEIQVEKTNEEVSGILSQIQNAPTIEELKTFKVLASAGDETLYNAYCQRLKQLSNG